MDPRHLADLARLVASFASGIHASAAGDGKPAATGKGYEVKGGLAIIPLRGVMVGARPWWADWLGIEVCVTPDLQCAVGDALADNAVKAIVLDIESPGGEVSGVADAADAVRAARSAKPVHAVVSNICASGAYWVASQAGDIAANETAFVGSIGVYTIHEDLSRLYGNSGVEIDVIASGPLKGAGVAGTALSPEQRADVQGGVDGLAEIFMAAVAGGRNKSRECAEKWATGGCWLAGKARQKGLIDHVETPAAALARIVSGQGTK